MAGVAGDESLDFDAGTSVDVGPLEPVNAGVFGWLPSVRVVVCGVVSPGVVSVGVVVVGVVVVGVVSVVVVVVVSVVVVVVVVGGGAGAQ